MIELNWHNYYHKPISFYSYFGNIFAHKTFIMSILKEKPRRVLEIGSGSGTMSIFLSYFVKEVISIDNNKRLLEICRGNNRKFSGKAIFKSGDAFELPFESNSFDVVFSQGLLEHFNKSDIIKILDEHTRVGETAVISVPNDNHIKEGIGGEVRWSKAQWDELLKKYIIIKSKNYGRAILKLFMNKPDQYFAKIFENKARK